MEDRHALLQKINEISFVFNDLTLYLDTHPMDSIAKSDFQQAASKRKELMQKYAKEFGPLTLDCSCEYHSWAEGPTPWEGGHIYCGLMKNDCNTRLRYQRPALRQHN